MKRREFLKFLGVAIVAAPAAVKVLAAVKPADVIQDWKQYGVDITIDHKRIDPRFNDLLDQKLENLRASQNKYLMSAIFDTTPLYERLNCSGLIRNITA